MRGQPLGKSSQKRCRLNSAHRQGGGKGISGSRSSVCPESVRKCWSLMLGARLVPVALLFPFSSVFLIPRTPE